jgi:hypothetical protein
MDKEMIKEYRDGLVKGATGPEDAPYPTSCEQVREFMSRGW